MKWTDDYSHFYWLTKALLLHFGQIVSSGCRLYWSTDPSSSEKCCDFSMVLGYRVLWMRRLSGQMHHSLLGREGRGSRDVCGGGREGWLRSELAADGSAGCFCCACAAAVLKYTPWNRLLKKNPPGSFCCQPTSFLLCVRQLTKALLY